MNNNERKLSISDYFSQAVYRPRFLGHRTEAYAALAAG